MFSQSSKSVEEGYSALLREGAADAEVAIIIGDVAFGVGTVEDGIEHKPHFGGVLACGDGAGKPRVSPSLPQSSQVVFANLPVGVVQLHQDEAGGISGALAKAFAVQISRPHPHRAGVGGLGANFDILIDHRVAIHIGVDPNCTLAGMEFGNAPIRMLTEFL